MMLKNPLRKIYKIFNNSTGKYMCFGAGLKYKSTWFINPFSCRIKHRLVERPELEVHIFEMVQIGTLNNLGNKIN